MKKQGSVAVLKTSPNTVVEDYTKLMHLAEYQKFVPKTKETILKLNLSWSLYFPACSTEPWQLEGVLKTLVGDKYKNIHCVENKTVVTRPWKGAEGNKWLPVLEKYGQKFQPLTDVEWVNYMPKHEMLALDHVFHDGHQIPKMFLGKNVLHLPTIKCVHPDTEIFKEDGSLVRIRDFVDEIFENNEVYNDEGDLVSVLKKGVISLGREGIVQSFATHFWKTPIEEHIIYVKLKTGKEVKVSKEHPFLTPRGWIRAAELEESDRIAIPRHIPIIGEPQKIPPIMERFKIPNINSIDFIKGKKHSAELQKYVVSQYLAGKTTTTLSKELQLNNETIRSFLEKYHIPIRWVRKIPHIPLITTPELWEWLGLLLSEGYVYECNGSLRTSWSNTDPILAQRYTKLTKELFDLELKVRKSTSSATDYYFDCNLIRPLYEFFEMKLPTNSSNKVIPSLLFKCTKEEIGAFITGYIDGDGTIPKDGIHIVSKSQRLIEQMQLLLIRLGVISFLTETKNKATNSNMEHETYYKLSIYGEEVVSLSKYLNLTTNAKKENLHQLITKRRESKHPSNWDTIPISSNVFKSIREGLNITQKSSGKSGSVNSIENKYSLPTREIVKYFIGLFKSKDQEDMFKEEINYLEFMASEEIAWDHIELIKEIEPDVPYLYDLSVPEHNNFIGNGIVLHNTHGHTSMTGAMKNAFGGLITEKRHHCHKMIHEVLVDLLQIQQEIHTGIFAVMDGTVCGDGAGPRTMIPKIKNYILASNDQVAIDAVSAKMMGYDPLKIPFIKMAHDRGLGMGDPDQIEILGEDISEVNFHFTTHKSPVVAGDQLFRKGIFSFVEPLLFHTPLFKFCILGSEWYHDKVWYPTIGKHRIRQFNKTEWGKLFKTY